MAKRILLLVGLALSSSSCIIDGGPCYYARPVAYVPPPCPAPVVVTRVVRTHSHGYGCGHRLLRGAWVTCR
jgi:hypothetical protein